MTKLIIMIIEICCSSLASFHKAIKGGASRIELCENLLEDGITPTSGFLKDVLDQTSVPVHVLIRPRSGNFFYSSKEVKTIALQIEMARSMGANGVVIGALNKDHSLPMKILKNWVKIAQSLDLTFHRAFDQVITPKESLKKIMDLGFNRVLTSGQQVEAVQGLDLLLELQNISKDELVIMPGGGINDQNCELFFKAGFNEIHLSAKGTDKTDKGEPISDLKIIEKVVASTLKFS